MTHATTDPIAALAPSDDGGLSGVPGTPGTPPRADAGARTPDPGDRTATENPQGWNW
jgi:hypothetical protein